MTSPDASKRSAVVLGGSGAIGSEVVALLAARGLDTHFTYLTNEAAARRTMEASGARGHRVDLRDAASFEAWLVERAKASPSVLIHAAGLLGPSTLDTCAPGALDAVHAVNVRAPLLGARALVPAMAHAGGGDLVFVSGLDRSQSLPIPAAFAASQAALSGAAMALAHELGRANIRVNVLASGLLETGLGTAIDAKLRQDYLAYSALRRFGTAAEIARVAVWLALDERAMTGKVVPVHGGI